MRKILIITFLSTIIFLSCNPFKKEAKGVIFSQTSEYDSLSDNDTIIIDSHYTFEESVAGSIAPLEIINQLELIDVQYYSTDGKIHQGQILTNKTLANDLKEIFKFILKSGFEVEHAIPVVKYGWYDDLSMQANNTYSFCYRNMNFSKHATGMAIDINPFLNPVIWKDGYDYRQNKPEQARRDTTVNGTLYESQPVVQEFIKHGFFWGHNFKMKFDDHHFEK
ncbi:MAG: M15 family metallopeptidase [Paludibacter sp.]